MHRARGGRCRGRRRGRGRSRFVSVVVVVAAAGGQREDQRQGAKGGKASSCMGEQAGWVFHGSVIVGGLTARQGPSCRHTGRMSGECSGPRMRPTRDGRATANQY
ncbi:hypothetical protein D3C72_1848250 [compost metagenome]